MKTKIIYISGNELFSMAEIRDAFEQVRNTLDLQDDTVLFAVPVDKDDAIPENQDIKITETVIVAPTEIITEPATEIIITENDPEEIVADAEINEVIEEIAEEIVDDAATETEKVIPILSVLAPRVNVSDSVPEDTVDAEQPDVMKMSDAAIAQTADENFTDEPTVIEEDQDLSEDSKDTIIISDDDIVIIQEDDFDLDDAPEDISSEDIFDETADNDAEITTTIIQEIITDEVPSNPMEKTLEELLESMAPLREDMIPDNIETNPEPVSDAENTAETSAEFTDDFDSDPDTDATLAQLANEFAETESSITATPKSQSKIGKLKNILPFKKARRDDSGLMGDLFGWAGIAANDDEFAMAGLFNESGTKK